MMPMRVHRKTRNMEKVENLCRTATVRKIMPTRLNKSDHACAIPWRPSVTVACSRSSTARRKVKM
jgi:hypothetical protein